MADMVNIESFELLNDLNYHFNSLNSLTNKLKENQYKIDSFSLRTGSIVKMQTDRNSNYSESHDAELLRLIEEKEKLTAQYLRHVRQMRQTFVILKDLNLNQREIRILTMKYDKHFGYTDMASRLNCSVMQCFEEASDILRRFNESYIRHGFTC